MDYVVDRSTIGTGILASFVELLPPIGSLRDSRGDSLRGLR
jgi:hypothetical protein